MRLRYTLEALAELEAVLGYLRAHSPSGARRVQTRLRAVEQRIKAYPDSGQLTKDRRLRRAVVTPFPYVLFYWARPEEVVVVGVRHGARKPTTMPARGE